MTKDGTHRSLVAEPRELTFGTPKANLLTGGKSMSKMVMMMTTMMATTTVMTMVMMTVVVLTIVNVQPTNATTESSILVRPNVDLNASVRPTLLVSVLVIGADSKKKATK